MSRFMCSLLCAVSALLAADAFAGQPLPKVPPLPASAADLAAAAALPARPVLPARALDRALAASAAQPVALPHAEMLKMVAARPQPAGLLADLFAAARPLPVAPLPAAPAPRPAVNVASR